MKRHLPRAVLSLIAAIAILARLVWPTAQIDGITLGLLALGGLPWLASIIKSIEVPGVGKLEMQHMEKRLDKAEGAAESAAAKADVALSGSRVSPMRSEGEEAVAELECLAQKYDALRMAAARGLARSAEMTELVSRAIDLAYSIDTANLAVTERVNARSAGRRVIGYGLAYARPESADLHELFTALAKEDQPFAQYWGLLAARRVVANARDLQVLEYGLRVLKDLSARFPPNTSRTYELERLRQDLSSHMLSLG